MAAATMPSPPASPGRNTYEPLPSTILPPKTKASTNESISQTAKKHLLDLSYKLMLYYDDDPSIPASLPKDHLAPDYTILLDCTQQEYSPSSYLTYCRRLRSLCPDLHLSITNATAQMVNYSCGVVYLPFQMTGLPGDLSKKMTHVMKWRKRDGVWTCYGHLGFQGMNLPPRANEEVTEKLGSHGNGRLKITRSITDYEDAKMDFLSSAGEVDEERRMGREEIDEILMRRFTRV